MYFKTQMWNTWNRGLIHGKGVCLPVEIAYTITTPSTWNGSENFRFFEYFFRIFSPIGWRNFHYTVFQRWRIACTHVICNSIPILLEMKKNVGFCSMYVCICKLGH